MFAPDPCRGTERQPEHHFFLQHAHAFEIDAFLNRFTAGAGHSLRSRHFVRVTIADADDALCFRLFFAGDIVLYFRSVSSSAGVPNGQVRTAYEPTP
jgi:hypothetical protein